MSQPTVGISIDTGVTQLTAALAPLPQQLRLALDRSVRKLRDWLTTQLARQLAREADISPKALQPRFHKRVERNGLRVEAHIWIGVNPIEAQRAGQARQLRRGAKVRGHMFDKAFVANVWGDDEKIWRRKGADRFPVVKMTIPIAEQMREILPRFQRPAAQKFGEIFEHELKYAMGFFK